MNLTESQLKAITERDRDACVMSGAGCGKTSVLVGRFVHLLECDAANVSEIAAITFTEKAALEMKERIRQACLDRARGVASADEAAVWETYSREIENAKIGTIHGFCARVLREFPVQTGVDPHFSVIDDGEAQVLIDRLLTETVRVLVEEDDSAAIRLVDEFGLYRTMMMVRALFSDVDQATAVARSVSACPEQAVVREMERVAAELRDAALDRLIQTPVWTEQIEFLSKHAAHTADDKREEARRTVLALAREVETAESADTRIEALRQIGDVALRGGKAANWPSEAVKEAVAEAIRRLRKLCKRYCTVCSPDSEDVVQHAACIGRALATTFLHCSEQYEAAKREESVLDFADLLMNARDLLRDNPSVRDYYRKSLKFILVDEFQDTDALQAAIIRYLTADDAGEYTEARLFVVGDAKQSIYRFRGADVSVFRETEEKVRTTGRIVDLDLTFRARPKIVSFVNDLFGTLIGRERKEELYDVVYGDLAAARGTVSASPEVELLLANAPATDGTLEDLRRQEADLIARRIRQMVDDGERMVSCREDGKESVRPVGYGDIAILFRAMTSVSAYERALREYEIPYYLTSGGGFYLRQEIKDILCFLKVLENADDDIALAGVLRSPMFGLSDNVLYWLTRDGRPLCESIAAHHDQLSDEERSGLSVAAHIIATLREMKDRQPIARLITEIVDRTGYLWVLRTMFLGRQRASNVRKLIETARQLERHSIVTLRDFISYVNEFVTQEIREGEAVIEEEKSDVVKVTTIHKAKGLEYPVVFVGDLSHGMGSTQRPYALMYRHGVFALKVPNRTGGFEPTALYRLMVGEDSAKDLAESKRLFYVACTRAQDYLVLSGVPGKGTHDSWMRWLETKYDLSGGDTKIPYGDEGFTVAVTTKLPPSKPLRGKASLAQKYAKKLLAFEPISAGKPSADFDAGAIFERTRAVRRSLQRKVRFSVTELEDYGKCPRLYELKHVDEIPESGLRHVSMSVLTKRELSPAERGNVAHRVFEQWDGDSEVGMRELVTRVLDERGILDGAVRAHVEDDIMGMYDRFMAHELSTRIREAADVRSELRFYLNLDGAVIEGVIDKTFNGDDGTRYLVDFKTDNVSANQANERAESYSFQLDIYALALSQLTDGSIPRASVYFLTPSVEVVRPVDRESLERVRAVAEERIGRIRANDFNPERDGRCDRCPFEPLCHR
jgi:ATP-dependent helicase/nuclease subunit A